MSGVGFTRAALAHRTCDAGRKREKGQGQRNLCILAGHTATRVQRRLQLCCAELPRSRSSVEFVNGPIPGDTVHRHLMKCKLV